MGGQREVTGTLGVLARLIGQRLAVVVQGKSVVAVVDVDEAGNDVDAQCVTRQPTQAPTAGKFVEVVSVFATDSAVVDVAVGAMLLHGQTIEQLIRT